MKVSYTGNKIITSISILVLIIAWELTARAMQSSQILPGPIDTFKALFKIIGQVGFMSSIGLTVWRGLIGFLTAIALSLIIGVVSGLSSAVEAAFRPLLVTIRSIPVISVILLALIWFQVDKVPLFIGLLTMFPILTKNITEGIKQTDHGLIEMARIFNVKPTRIISHIYLPSILPYLLSGISTAIGFGWRAVIIGEVLAQPRYGIGAMMQDAQSFLLVADLLAWTLIAVIFGFLFEMIIVRIEKSLIRWK